MNRAEQEHQQAYYSEYARKFAEQFTKGYLAELLPSPHFVVWKQEFIAGQPKKPPYNPKRRESRADVSDETTWGSWQEALTALASGHFQGIGFVFAKAGKTPDRFFGVDLDHCTATNRSLFKWAEDIRDFLKTHGHYSPRDGAHFIGKGRLPGPGRKFGPLEFFDRDHYLTLTPNPLPGTPQTIEPAQIEVSYLYLMQTRRERQVWHSAVSTGGALLEPTQETGWRADQETADQRVIREALEDQRSNFTRYWSGDQTVWMGPEALKPSRSEAEYTLALMLLTQTNDSEEDAKRLFQQSGLYDKARCSRFSGRDPQTGQPLTYLDVTVRNALRFRQAQRKRRP